MLFIETGHNIGCVNKALEGGRERGVGGGREGGGGGDRERGERGGGGRERGERGRGARDIYKPFCLSFISRSYTDSGSSETR